MKLDWDSEIDTPATVVVIGGGLAGIEAALYARFLGYTVLLLESKKVGQSLARWGERGIDATWSEITSPLGLAALEAQGKTDLPTPDSRISYRQFVEKYVLPVARTDLLYESIQIYSRVRSISRLRCLPQENVPTKKLAELEFRVLIESQNRGEYTQLADIVLDCSGLGSLRNGLAQGGGLAIGESAHESKFLSGKLDCLGKKSQQFAGKHLILWGDSLEATSNAIDISELTRRSPGTRLTWVLPKRRVKPTNRFEFKGFPEFALAAGELVDCANPSVVTLDAWGIENLKYEDGQGWQLRLQIQDDESLDITGDEFLNCADTHPDWRATETLCSGPLLENASFEDSEDQDQRCGITNQPHYYVLGEKAWHGARHPFASLQSQIREAFALIGGRHDLDLYRTVKPKSA